MIGIYKITNKLNGKSYIGQSVNIKRRWSEHKILSKDGALSLTRAFRKYGVENFKFEVIHKLKKHEIDKMNCLEIYYIEKYKPEYNRTKGGKGAKGHFVSKEVRKILSEKGKEQWNNMSYEEQQNQIKNNLTGRKKGFTHSQETREKIRKTLQGGVRSEEAIKKTTETWKTKKEKGIKKDGSGHYKPIIINETKQTFKSVKVCAEFLGVNPSGISSQLKGKQKTVKGYTFSYLECRG